MSLEKIEHYGPGGYDPKMPNGNLLSVETIEVPDPEPTELDQLRARVAEFEALLVKKEVITKEEAEAVATTEIAATEITKPGETKDDGGKDDQGALDAAVEAVKP